MEFSIMSIGFFHTFKTAVNLLEFPFIWSQAEPYPLDRTGK